MTTSTETSSSGPRLRDVRAQTAAAVRVVRTLEDLPAAFGEFLPKVAAALNRAGMTFAGPPYARYHGMGEHIDVEIGVPIAGLGDPITPLVDVPAGEVGLSSLPGGRVVETTYVGPYSGLGEAWQELDRWLQDQGLTPAGAGWESYIDDPDEVAPEAMRTLIVLPVS
jgi:effector-binding domain-containing protein